jgi:uncharacterized protein (DUF1697 family)
VAGRRAALFLRGINVGGRHKVPMADLRAVLDDLGLGPSSTHLQSGNAVIVGRAGPKIEETVAEALAAEFEFEVPVVSRSAADLQSVVERNPFPGPAADDPKLVQVLFLREKPAIERVGAVDPDRWTTEDWQVDGRELYVHFREGSGRSKLTVDDVERQIGVAATARNWNTVTAMAAKASASG